MTTVRISAGTYAKTSEVWFSAKKDSADHKYEIEARGDRIELWGSYGSNASGGYMGGYGVTRSGSFSAPISVAVELCVRGLSDGEYSLTRAEVARLLAAISRSIALKEGQSL